jgi:hypothetical protein
MSRPGRNDPCPCGSGRKYKRCCLGHEAEHDAYAAALEATALPLLSGLLKFAETATRAPLESVAAADFPFWHGAFDEAKASRVVEHLMFDARLERYGRTAIDEFVLERAHALREDERRLLADWQAARHRLYRVDGWSAGFLRCRDLLTEEAAEVRVWPLGRAAGLISDGAPVALRALPAADAAVCIGRPTQFGARQAEEVAQAVRSRHLAFVRSQRIIGIDEFLRVVPVVLDEEAAAGSRASSIIVPGA